MEGAEHETVGGIDGDRGASATERWVIVGGTFDPVHDGHLQLARTAVERLGATLGVLAVGASHPHRPAVVLPWHTRVQLVRDAVADEPTLVEAGEVGAHRRGVVLVGRTLRSSHRELHFVFGSDSAARLARWGGGVELTKLGTVWAVERSAASTVLPAGVRPLVLPTLDMSSTEVRARCASGADINGLVPTSIHDQVVDAYGTTPRHPLARPA